MLLLKNEVKDLFRKAGLPDFSVGRNANNELAIIGSCGKPLVKLTMDPVGSKLAVSERKILINDYIKPSLTSHKKTLLELIANTEKAKKADEDLLTLMRKTETTYNATVSRNRGYSNDKTANITIGCRLYNTSRNTIVKLVLTKEEGTKKVAVRFELESIETLPKAQKLRTALMVELEKIYTLEKASIKADKTKSESATKLVDECTI